MVERHRVSSISRRRVMRGCYRGWTNGKIDVRVAVISVGSTKKHEHHWENVNVWTPDVVCTTRLGIQCRQFDPVSGPFSMNNERSELYFYTSLSLPSFSFPVHTYIYKPAKVLIPRYVLPKIS